MPEFAADCQDSIDSPLGSVKAGQGCSLYRFEDRKVSRYSRYVTRVDVELEPLTVEDYPKGLGIIVILCGNRLIITDHLFFNFIWLRITSRVPKNKIGRFDQHAAIIVFPLY